MGACVKFSELGKEKRKRGKSMRKCAFLLGVGILTARHQVTIFLFVSDPHVLGAKLC